MTAPTGPGGPDCVAVGPSSGEREEANVRRVCKHETRRGRKTKALGFILVGREGGGCTHQEKHTLTRSTW